MSANQEPGEDVAKLAPPAGKGVVVELKIDLTDKEPQEKRAPRPGQQRAE